VDVYRNGNRIAVPSNSGSYSDPINVKGSGTYSYKVCETTSPSACTNSATLAF